MQAITAVKWAESSELFFVSFSLIWLLSCDIITIMWSKFNHLWIKSNSYKVHMNQTSRLFCSIHMNQILSILDLIQFDRSSNHDLLFYLSVHCSYMSLLRSDLQLIDTLNTVPQQILYETWRIIVTKNSIENMKQVLKWFELDLCLKYQTLLFFNG